MTKRTKKAKRRSTAAERLKHRLHCVSLVLEGRSARELARETGDSFGAIASWVRRFRARGVEGLKEEKRAGRPSKLSPVEMRRIERFVSKARTRPEAMTAPALAKHIKVAFGVTLTARQCARILKRVSA